MSATKASSGSPRARIAPALEQPDILPVDAPRQFPMCELWARSYGAHLNPRMPLGCGIHGPQDYDTKVEIEHLQTCIANIKLSILEGTVGLSRLHDALDLADRTARSRKPQATRKRVRFSPHPTASNRNISYFAAELHYKGMTPEAGRIAYYCADRRCGCKVNEFFRNEDEHDEHVRLRARARARARRSAESSSSDSSSVSKTKGKSGIDTKSKRIRAILNPWRRSSGGSEEQKRKRGEVSPPMRKQKLGREKSHRGCMYM